MNQEENEFLKEMGNISFLGLNDILTEGVWMWEHRPSNVQWYDWIDWTATRKEPDSGSEGNCVLLTKRGWIDMVCTSPGARSLICERNGEFIVKHIQIEIYG